MIEEVRIGQIWKKKFAETKHVKVVILDADEHHIVSIVIESDVDNRPIGQIMRMCLCGENAFDRKLNAFGWIPQDGKPIEYVLDAKHLLGCQDRKLIGKVVEHE